jgi:parallel beta-helix repeat protein
MNVKSRSSFVTIILFSLCLATFAANTGKQRWMNDGIPPFPPQIIPSVAHGRINIVGNTQLAAFFAGNSSDGTSGNPYIIQGFEINAGGSGSAIDIRNTNKNVIIQSCSLSGTNGATNMIGSITLNNCTNVIIRWNTISTNVKNGIYMDGSTNVRITGNTIASNDLDGISITSSHHVTITDNIITNSYYNGISVYSSSNFTISKNTIRIMGRDGLDADTVDPPLVMANNTITDCASNGIWVGTIYGAVIADNRISQCDYYGLDIQGSSCGNNFTHNLVTNCTFAGIDFYNGDTNTTGNKIWLNAFTNNRDGNVLTRWLTPGDNDWDVGGLGNYWGDYEEKYPTATQSNNIWSIPYEINETKTTVDYDHFPLASSDLMTQSPPGIPGVEIAVVIIVIAFLAAAVVVVFKAHKEDVFLPVKRR